MTEEENVKNQFDLFCQVIKSRRSARTYLSDIIPESVLDKCLEMAITAPSSHNLEIWRLLVIKDPEVRKKMNLLCLSQSQVLQAPTMIVAVARPDLWKIGCKKMLTRLKEDAANPMIDDNYKRWIPNLIKKYKIIVPLLFFDGPFHILAPLKMIIMWIVALFRPMMRGPFGRSEQQMWAIKTAALACETFMLALSASGYDTCALEGFDEPRLRKLLSLPNKARIVMVILAGKKGPDALIPQIRFEKSHYVQTI
jgi:nitroreductase